MVSLIVSSYNDTFFNIFEKSVDDTIGVPYEIIRINNPNLMGICEAYNKGAARAVHPYLCFLHEDLRFLNSNWANLIIKQFETDVKIGLIGITGSKYKSLSPGGWTTYEENIDLLHIVNHDKEKKNAYVNYLIKEFEEVICLDGVFLFTTKEIWQNNNFDQTTFTNFHCYDIDFSFKIGLTKKVLVTNTVLIEHFSMGSYNKSWIDESIKFHKKWKSLLPKGEISYNIKKKIEYQNTITFLLRMISYRYSLFQLFSVGFGYGFKYFSSLFKSIIILKLITFGYTKNILWTRK